MDNTRFYNGVSSYDFSLFTDRSAAVKAVPKPKPRVELPAARAKKKRSPAGAVLAVLFAALLLAMVSAEIYLRAEITGVRARVTAVQKEISEIDSRRTGLEMQLEQKTAYRNLEEAARELGMQQPNRDQIVYFEAED